MHHEHCWLSYVLCGDALMVGVHDPGSPCRRALVVDVTDEVQMRLCQMQEDLCNKSKRQNVPRQA